MEKFITTNVIKSNFKKHKLVKKFQKQADQIVTFDKML